MGIISDILAGSWRRPWASIALVLLSQPLCFGYPQFAEDAVLVAPLVHAPPAIDQHALSDFPIIAESSFDPQSATERPWPVELVQPSPNSNEVRSSPTQTHRNTGFLDFNFYPYTSVDSDNAITINALANLNHGFQYFSLTNFGRNPNWAALQEVDAVLTEQNLRWKPDWDLPIAMAGQALLRTGVGDNDVLRFGPRWTGHKTGCLEEISNRFHLKYWIACYGLQFDHTTGNQWQIEYVFRWDVLPELLDNRVYLSGFVDQNIDHSAGTKTTWLEETQLGVRVLGDWHVVAEQRYNGFRRGREASLGLGLEYVMRFK